MMSINEYREKYFLPTINERFSVEYVDEATFVDLYKNHFRAISTSTICIDMDEYIKKSSSANENLRPNIPDESIDRFIVYDGKRPVAQFHGIPKSKSHYLMHYSVVHPEYRRQGIYTEMLKRFLTYTKELGYSMIISDHKPTNQPILIAKLQQGFNITNFHVNISYGVEVELTYFHDAHLLAAYQFRCGEANLSPWMKEFSNDLKQFQEGKELI